MNDPYYKKQRPQVYKIQQQYTSIKHNQLPLLLWIWIKRMTSTPDYTSLPGV